MGTPADFIPDSDFKPDQAPQPAQAQRSPDFIPDNQFQADDEKYEGFGQQALGAGEAASKGLLGHTITAAAEKGLTGLGVPGLSPEEQHGRESYLQSVNPALPGVAEAGGFGLGMLGAGIAKPIAAVGEAAQGALGLGEAATVGSKLAAGAARTGAELAAMQTDNEVAKAINGDSKGIGDAATNVGLAALMGGVGGGALSGLGVGAKGALDAMGFKEFADRLAARGAMGVHPHELIEKEFGDAHELLRNIGTEVGGVNGIGAAARENLMPELHSGMLDQAQELSNKITKMSDTLEARGDQSGMAGELRSLGDRIERSINPTRDLITNQPTSEISSGNIYDTLNSVKKQLGEWGQFNKNLVPLSEQSFRNTAKGLGHDFKMALENEDTWGKVGGLQKSLNEAWSSSIPALKDAESKFMEKIGGVPVISPQKFMTYLNQNGRTTSQTVRQKMMGNFVDSVEKWQKAAQDAYEKAGMEYPHDTIGLGSIKDSLEQHSIGVKLADAWHDKMSAKALGDVAGGALGNLVAPGISGVYLGKWALGPVMGSILKPIVEKASSMPGYQAAFRFAKNVAEGNSRFAKATGTLFTSGLKTVPSHWVPDAKQLLHLDDTLKKAQGDQASLLNANGNLGHYLPDNAMMMTKTTSSAVAYLNSQRPAPLKPGPLDKEIPPSKAQVAEYQRKLEIAEQPLMVLQHAKDGTILPSDVAVLKNVYPEYYEKMSAQVMTAMMEHVHDGGTVSYQTRQGLSMLLGQPLDATMRPDSIQSIQATYAQNQQQSQQAQASGRVKKGTAKLNQLATNMQTPDQARAARANKA